jgi:hypothetical protein
VVLVETPTKEAPNAVTLKGHCTPVGETTPTLVEDRNAPTRKHHTSPPENITTNTEDSRRFSTKKVTRPAQRERNSTTTSGQIYKSTAQHP